MISIFCMVSAVLVLFLGIDANAANDPQLVMEEFVVPAVDPGIALYVLGRVKTVTLNCARARSSVPFGSGKSWPG